MRKVRCGVGTRVGMVWCMSSTSAPMISATIAATWIMRGFMVVEGAGGVAVTRARVAIRPELVLFLHARNVA
jgi:hypothetical protein